MTAPEPLGSAWHLATLHSEDLSAPPPHPVLLPFAAPDYWKPENDAHPDQYTHSWKDGGNTEHQLIGVGFTPSLHELCFVIFSFIKCFLVSFRHFCPSLCVSLCAVWSTLHQSACWPHAGSKFISVQHRPSRLWCFQCMCVCSWQCVRAACVRGKSSFFVVNIAEASGSIWSTQVCFHDLRELSYAGWTQFQMSGPSPNLPSASWKKKVSHGQYSWPQQTDISIKCIAGFTHYRWLQKFQIICL